MKKISVLVVFLLSSVLSFSQVFNIKLGVIQNFEHPQMLTNQAILEKKVTYLDKGYVNSTYSFDLTKKILLRNRNGEIGEFPIVRTHNSGGLFDVDVLFSNGQVANFTLTQVDETDDKMLVCRWIENNSIVIKGWYDKKVDVK